MAQRAACCCRCRLLLGPLTGASLGDDALLAHAQAHERLAERVVDLVGAGVVEVLALEVDVRAGAVRALEALGQALSKVQRGGTADVVFQDGVQLGLRQGARAACFAMAGPGPAGPECCAGWRGHPRGGGRRAHRGGLHRRRSWIRTWKAGSACAAL
jgi:hypothetical protein